MKTTKPKLLRLSPSSINTFIRCPKEFYYSYIERLPQPVNIHLIKGILVHTVFEKFFGKKFRADFETYAEELFWEAYKGKEEDLKSLKLTDEVLKKEQNDCLNMINIYILHLRLRIDYLKQIGKINSDKHGFYMLRPKFKEVWLEDKELGLCGYIDRIHTDWDGKTTIGDYKTSARFGIGIKDEYELQCGLYALLYKRCKGLLADKVSIIYLRYGEEPNTRVTPDLIKYALLQLKYVRDNTTSKDIKDYPRNETGFCRWCSWFKQCSGLNSVERDLKLKQMEKELKAKKK